MRSGVEVANHALIKKINRYFHDEESRFFSDRHRLRIRRESLLFSDFFRNSFKEIRNNPAILDIGTGTGLVPMSLPDEKCFFVCADISNKMLSSTRNKLESGSNAKYAFVACDAENLPFGDSAFDIITCNAAMHHIPDIGCFAREMNRVLVPGGKLIIGFEANRRFVNNRLLNLTYRFLSKIKGPGRGAGYGDICKKVNERMLGENIIEKPLSDTDILRFVDTHSPTASDRIDYSKGFDINELKALFKNFRIRVIYHYSDTFKILAALNRIFYPESATQFSFIMEKAL